MWLHILSIDGKRVSKFGGSDVKLKPGHKVAFLLAGLLFAWFAFYIMLADFYEGIVGVVVAAVEGGTYYPHYFGAPLRLFWWVICVMVSSLCLAIGLKAEELSE